MNKMNIKLNKILILIAIILIALSGFSIRINGFEFEWLGVLKIIIKMFEQFTIQKYQEIEGEVNVKEENIKINYETIGVVEQRNLIEAARDLGRAMTEEEYVSIMLVYKKVIDRLTIEAEKQGIKF